MKKTLIAVLAATLMAGCTSTTPYGHCVGLNQEKLPELRYEYSAWNIFLAVLFSETIIVPLVVLLDEHSCPVGKKAAP